MLPIASPRVALLILVVLVWFMYEALLSATPQGVAMVRSDADDEDATDRVLSQIDGSPGSNMQRIRAKRVAAPPIDDPLETPLQRIRRAGGGRSKDRIESMRGEYGWRFKAYHSSALEEDFYRDVLPYANETVWPKLVTAYTDRARRLMAASVDRVPPNTALTNVSALFRECNGYRRAMEKRDDAAMAGTCLGSPAPMDPTLFSRFVYEFVCLGEPCTAPVPSSHQLGEEHTSFIEPLFGALRHPAFFLSGGDGRFVVEKDYMVVDKWALNNLHTRWSMSSAQGRKSFFIDMGASTYTSGLGGASQNWFVGVASCMCVPFSEMHLFEAKFLNTLEVWVRVPEYLHPHYRWYNYPLSTDEASWRNPLNHLLSKLSSTEDVVTMKVDFDSPGLENRIIATILNTPDLYESIDELFYEYHVPMAYMHPYWGHGVDHNATVMTSIDLFRALRRRGIRAHSWV